MGYRKRHLGPLVAAMCCGVMLACGAAAEQAPEDPNELARMLANPLASVNSLTTEVRLAAGQGPGRQGLVNDVTLTKPFELPQSWAIVTNTLLPTTIMQNSNAYWGLGDANLAAVLVAPPRNDMFFGAGVVTALPSATRAGLGARNWAAGPVIAGGYQGDVISANLKLTQGWTLGGPTGQTRTTLTALRSQISLGLGDGWSAGVNGEMDYDWEGAGRSRWTVPVSLTLSRVFTFSDARAFQIGSLITHYALPGGPHRAVWEFGLNLTFVVPQGYFFQ
jgi:hypothetical protein